MPQYRWSVWNAGNTPEALPDPAFDEAMRTQEAARQNRALALEQNRANEAAGLERLRLGMEERRLGQQNEQFFADLALRQLGLVPGSEQIALDRERLAAQRQAGQGQDALGWAQLSQQRGMFDAQQEAAAAAADAEAQRRAQAQRSAESMDARERSSRDFAVSQEALRQQRALGQREVESQRERDAAALEAARRQRERYEDEAFQQEVMRSAEFTRQRERSEDTATRRGELLLRQGGIEQERGAATVADQRAVLGSLVTDLSALGALPPDQFRRSAAEILARAELGGPEVYASVRRAIMASAERTAEDRPWLIRWLPDWRGEDTRALGQPERRRIAERVMADVDRMRQELSLGGALTAPPVVPGGARGSSLEEAALRELLGR